MRSSVRHISVDFWSTLYHPNHVFSTRRVDTILDFFSYANINRVGLINCLNEVGRQNDLLVESQGCSISKEELYKNVFSRIGLSISSSTFRPLCEALDTLFLSHKPNLIHEEYARLLARLSDKGITMSISSNTAFVPGDLLEICMKQDGLQSFFDFMLFSDQVGFAKPSQLFFEKVFIRANDLYQNALAKEDILHVGDNFITDIEGAGSFGFQTLHVCSPADLFKLEAYV
ncbi:MAG: HAD family hydrolase [Bacteroidetes bacterium]|nr:HAD family hydrolase [Bacteroidota bacterium]